MGHPTPEPYRDQPLTAEFGDVQKPCASPICDRAVVPNGRGKKFCSDRCRLDGYVIRRAKTMIVQLGVSRFTDLLKAT